MISKKSNPELLIVKTTEINFDKAKNIANEILKMKLAACINFSEVNSTYWWEDKLVESSEVQLTIKTREIHLKEIFKLIKSLHTYKTPEFIFYSAFASKEYNQWIQEITYQI